MRNTRKVALFPLLAITMLLLLFTPGHAQARKTIESLRHFVQGFYSWYVPIALQENEKPAFDLALKQKPSVFSSQLLRALQDDSEAQAKVSGEIVGIDWDPFLNSQDPYESYKVGRITKKGRTYWVEIHGVLSDNKRPKPDVIAEVNQDNGKWFFVNFHRPGGGDLLSSLELLKKSRQESR